MAKQERNQKSAFVIKLSTETLQKLEDEEQSKHTNQELSSIPEKSKHINEVVSQNNPMVIPGDEHDKIQESLNSKNETIIQKENVANNRELHNESNKCNIKNSEESPNTDWGEYSAYVTYEGDQAIYTDPSTQQKYSWNSSSTSWDVMSGEKDVQDRVYSYENDTHVYTEADGSKFFWDTEKKAWIPKVDDDFLARYQMSYGFIDNTKKDDEDKNDSKSESKKKSDITGMKRKTEPQWFEATDETNTKVYVSNLPLDLTEEEFVNFMQKCGLVERDPITQKMKIKLYVDKEQDCFKGDALCTYIKIESVDLALKLLDGCDFKGNKVKVERAHFQLKGEYNPALKPKKKKKKEIEKIKKMQQKLFDWRPEKFIGERSKHERIVIVKNLFHPSDFDKDVQLILDYQQDLREESGKCGEVRKVVIYDRHPEGVAQITMKEPEQADAVVQLINGRWFGKRQITAEIWDGRTKYRIAETDADISKRINKWDKFLEGEDDKNKQSDLNNADSQKNKKDENDKDTDKNKEEICSDTLIKECEKSDTNIIQCEPIEPNDMDCTKRDSDV